MNDETKIHIYWIRHGHSCGNYLKDTKGIKKFTIMHEYSLYDPLLSNKGRIQALLCPYAKNKTETIADLFARCDFFGSSMLARAIETAIYCFGMTQLLHYSHKEIYMLPYISEKRIPFSEGTKKKIMFIKKYATDYENTPLPWNEQKERFQTLVPNPLDSSLITNQFREYIDEANIEIQKPNIKEFLKVLNEIIIEKIKNKKQNDITIAIVSHHKFIEKWLKLHKEHKEHKIAVKFTPFLQNMNQEKKKKDDKIPNLGIHESTFTYKELTDAINSENLKECFSTPIETIYFPNNKYDEIIYMNRFITQKQNNILSDEYLSNLSKKPSKTAIHKRFAFPGCKFPKNFNDEVLQSLPKEK